MGIGRSVPRDEWEKVDWNQTARQIANELGVSYPTVLRWAKRLGKESELVRDVRGPDSKVDWQAVDYSRPNNELAEEINVSVRQVQKMRRKWSK